MTAIEQGPQPERLPLPSCIEDDPAYVAAFEEWALKQYNDSPTDLLRLRSLAQMSLPQAWNTVTAKGGSAVEYLAERQQDYVDGSEEAAREKLWADLMHAEIVGSPLGKMYDELYPCEPRKLKPTGEAEIDFLPRFSGLAERKPVIHLDANGPVPRLVSSGYFVMQMVYDVNREMHQKDTEEDTCKRAARMLTFLTLLRPESTRDFIQAMHWLDYGDQLFRDSYNLHTDGVKIDFAKFRGEHGEDAASLEDFRELSRIFDIAPGERQPEIVQYIRGQIDAEQSKPDADRQQIATLQAALKDTAAQPEWFDRQYAAVRKEYFATLSLGLKAVDLSQWLAVRGSEDEEKIAPRVPWLTEASRELIEDTHRRLGAIDPGDARAKDRIEKESVLRYLFGIAVEVDNKAMKWVPRLLNEHMKPLKNLIAFVDSRGEKLQPDEIFRLARVTDSKLQDLNNLLGQGHTLKELAKSPGLALSMPREGQDFFPAQIRSSAVRHHWLVNNAETHPGSGWNKVNIGKFLAAQLQTGEIHTGEVIDLDDASKVLEHFRMPHQENGKIYFDASTEKFYLASILSLSTELRAAAQLSGKQPHIDQLFYFPDNAAVYEALLELNDTSQAWDLAALRALVGSRREQYYAEFTDPQNPRTTERLTASDFYQQLEDTIDLVGQLTNAIQTQDALRVTRLSELSKRQNTLRMLGKNRLEYTRDATAWLLKHATNPAEQLATAWQYRPAALAAGTKDTASEILYWYQKNQFMYHFESTERIKGQPSNAEIYQRHQHWFDELLRYYTPGIALEAVRACAPTGKEPALLPATRRAIQLDNDNQVFTGEILDADDPRGLTIGVDSGCCMNWYTKALRPLLEAAYQLPEAGFFAIRNKAGRMVAQSMYFVDPAHPETLVIDSIEPNAGRSAQKVVDLYETFWRDYLTKRSQDTPGWQVQTVNVGVPGYLGEEDAIYQVLQKLPEAPAIVYEKMGYHADSRKQRRLFSLSEEELARPVANELPAEKPTEKSALHLVTALDKEKTISDLSRQIFADSLNERERISHFSGMLARRFANIFSFVGVPEPQALDRAIGHCIAYAIPHKDDPTIPATLVIDEFGVLPEHTNSGAGLRMLKELLDRAQEAGIDRITFSDKLTRSGDLVKSKALQDRVRAWGYIVINNNRSLTTGPTPGMIQLERPNKRP